MKTFDELTTEQKDEAVNMASYELMSMIADGTLEMELTDPSNQRRLNKILFDARKAESTRLVKLYLLHDKPIRMEIERLALVAAHGSEYDDSGEALKEVDSETAKRIIGQS
jgi:hypothetical protein